MRLRPLSGGGGGASIELVDIGGRPFVLKRQTERHAKAERCFQQAMRAAGRPHLEVFEHPALEPGEILLEYVDGSATVGRAPSVAAFRAWGAAIADLHAIRFDQCLDLGPAGDPLEVGWGSFLERTAAAGVSRQRARADGLPARLVDRIEACLGDLRAFEPDGFALCHGDLHMNNALLRDGSVVLFDKGSGTWATPAVFDLAVVYSEAFPGARYVSNPARAGDDERLAAFLSGYGGLPEGQAAWIDHFVLLRALRRYPNPFVPDLLATLEAAADRASAAARWSASGESVRGFAARRAITH